LEQSLHQLRIALLIVMICTLIILSYGIYSLMLFETIGIQKRFLGFVSHELRTSLTAISGEAESFTRYPHSSQEAGQIIHNIAKETKWMNRLLSDLLLLFNKRASHETVTLTWFNASDAILDVASTIKRNYPQKKIELQLPEASDIKANPDRFRQMLYNLMENAAKYTDETGRIVVTLAKTEKQFVLKVTDNGVGIKKADQSQIFKEFYRTASAIEKGAGLGLAIVKWIVDLHRGKIHVESELGKGSAFTVTIPNQIWIRSAAQYGLIQDPAPSR
jgi:signal transduction histidine kinase